MEFLNQSGLPAGWTLGFEPDGRELLIVVVKATYSIPEATDEPSLAAMQIPLVEDDKFTGEPGCSAPLHETDYAHRKPYCDVLLNGSAYAPHGRPIDRVPVSLSVGAMQKRFWVFGDRKWEALITVAPSDPKPFTSQGISYDRAYGGSDFDERHPEKRDTYRANPIGVGFYPIRDATQLAGRPLPNTAQGPQPITDAKGDYKPMAFGPVGRNFDPRYRFAGTYDDEWLNQRAPFWPNDFSYRYFQAAPEDQQTPYLVGGEEVVLENLAPAAITRFRIPQRQIPVTFIPYRGPDRCVDAVCDTLLIEPDQGRFMLTWRVSLPLRQNCFEIKQAVLGEMPYSWRSQRRAQSNGKTYYRSLADLPARRPVEGPVEGKTAE